MEAALQEGYKYAKMCKRRIFKMTQKLRDVSNEMHLRKSSLTTLDARTLRGDQINL